MKTVITVKTSDDLSDHLPKRMDVWLRKPKFHESKKSPPKILWETLRDPKICTKFSKETDKEVKEQDHQPNANPYKNGKRVM